MCTYTVSKQQMTILLFYIDDTTQQVKKAYVLLVSYVKKDI